MVNDVSTVPDWRWTITLNREAMSHSSAKWVIPFLFLNMNLIRFARTNFGIWVCRICWTLTIVKIHGQRELNNAFTIRYTNLLQVVDVIKHLLTEITSFWAPRSTNHSAKSNQSDLLPTIQYRVLLLNFWHAQAYQTCWIIFTDYYVNLIRTTLVRVLKLGILKVVVYGQYHFFGCKCASRTKAFTWNKLIRFGSIAQKRTSSYQTFDYYYMAFLK